MGIQYLTLYAFSTENWNRPDTEVEALMKLLATYLKNCIKRADKNNMRIRVIGDISRLDTKFQNTIRDLEEATKKNTGLNLQIALNYGSRDEMIRAMKKMVKDHDAGKLEPEDITEECFSSYAYSEFYFTPVPWPDFSKAELEKAVEAYNQRDRRYGGVKEEA